MAGQMTNVVISLIKHQGTGHPGVFGGDNVYVVVIIVTGIVA